MHDRPGSTSLECSGPLAILFLHESTPHPPATFTCSLDNWGKRFQIPIFPRTTCVWGGYNQPGRALTSSTAGVHECVNQQHCRDTPLRHLAILQYTTSLYAGCHANTRAYRSSKSLLLGTPPVCGRIFNYSALSENTPPRSGSRPRTMHPFTRSLHRSGRAKDPHPFTVKYRSPQPHLLRTPPVRGRRFYYYSGALHDQHQDSTIRASSQQPNHTIIDLLQVNL